VDDAYLGGERTGGKPDRGSESKVSFFAAVSLIRHAQIHFESGCGMALGTARRAHAVAAAAAGAAAA